MKHLLYASVYIISMFLTSVSNVAHPGTFSTGSTGLFVWKCPLSAPPLCSKACLQVDPYNNRDCDWSALPRPSSHKVSLTSPALLERQTQLVLLAKVLGAWMFSWRHVSCVAPMMDGANCGYTFTPTHPTCSSIDGGWLSCLFWMKASGPNDVF